MRRRGQSKPNRNSNSKPKRPPGVPRLERLRGEAVKRAEREKEHAVDDYGFDIPEAFPKTTCRFGLSAHTQPEDTCSVDV